jgi:hypothetical protein
LRSVQNSETATIRISAGSGARVEADLRIGKRKHHVYFQGESALLRCDASAFAALSLLPCMKAGCDMFVDGAVSDQLLRQMAAIQDIYLSWQPSLRRVNVTAATRTAVAAGTGNRVATFFSAGVDSFYTLLRHRDEITHLVFVHGFDIKLDDHARRRQTAELIQEVGREFGKHVIEVETSAKSFLNAYVPWANLSHGAGLASVGLVLSRLFGKIFIAGGTFQADLIPWGTHPELDPLWSTEATQFVHDGREATRVEKMEVVAQSETALQFLRVCNEPTPGGHNCGRCEKCLRTMISLHGLGALDRCRVFDEKLEVARVRKLIIPPDDEHVLMFYRQNARLLEDKPDDRPLYAAVLGILHPRRPWWQTKTVREIRRIGRQVRSVVAWLRGRVRLRSRS